MKSLQAITASTLLPVLAALALAAAAQHAVAQVPAAAPGQAASAHAGGQDALSEGEITRWDARTLRVTLRHGEIKNLDMPPMTMVFRVQDASVVGDLKPGDKVRFRAEQVGGAYHVTRLEKAP
ncbi:MULTISPECIES: copper-binding protein [unclassified Acidovorax]|uniref:copper-binding protein n=1 Tax=unclassified Acidovorax TaxID=2684926 RepID=UPI001C455EC6|nr:MULTISPECIES: copper-binding protein [unclassified Acidovorax]MBV7427207.1 copper-binding protein [Acidovorax sp. sif0732]MBV7448331.1 copper-binding protein [Acidovorax sp. sif0715]